MTMSDSLMDSFPRLVKRLAWQLVILGAACFLLLYTNWSGIVVTSVFVIGLFGIVLKLAGPILKAGYTTARVPLYHAWIMLDEIYKTRKPRVFRAGLHLKSPALSFEKEVSLEVKTVTSGNVMSAAEETETYLSKDGPAIKVKWSAPYQVGDTDDDIITYGRLRKGTARTMISQIITAELSEIIANTKADDAATDKKGINDKLSRLFVDPAIAGPLLSKFGVYVPIVKVSNIELDAQAQKARGQRFTKSVMMEYVRDITSVTDAAGTLLPDQLTAREAVKIFLGLEDAAQLTFTENKIVFEGTVKGLEGAQNIILPGTGLASVLESGKNLNEPKTPTK